MDRTRTWATGLVGLAVGCAAELAFTAAVAAPAALARFAGAEEVVGTDPNTDAALARGEGMVRIPGGSFFRGCNESVDSECASDEKPGRTMNLPGFSIDKTEVTVEAYRACVSASVCGEPRAGDNWGRTGREQHPVSNVDWNQATAYCRWKGKRLPTEAEWEKAARGTDGRKYPWGNTPPSCDKANLSGCGGDTQVVGGRTAGASPYGTLDMSGNVSEWTGKWYQVNASRSLRGGSWSSEPRTARASNRNRHDPGVGTPSSGFRCAQ